MKNEKYWKKRFEQIEQLEHNDSSELIHKLEGHYNKAEREIDSKIRSWYQRFADNNEISMSEARKILRNDELKEFKWDVKEYIKYGQENELNERWMKELENVSAKYHISRLESLKIQTQQSLEVLYGNQLDELDGHIKDIYSNTYYHSLYELQNGFNIGWDVARIDQRKLEKIISKPWAVDGKNFSNRIWDNKNKIINELHNELTQMTLLGQGPDNAISNIARKMKTSKVNAGRLVMTESAYFSSLSQKDAFKDLDVEQYEILATLDSRTSDICQELDGKVFNMINFEAGVTAPPFHVWCRTTTVPYFDDEFNIGERAARDEDGKTYYIPSNMKYKDWKKSFVDSGSKTGLNEINPADIITDERLEEFKKFYEDWDGKNVKPLAVKVVDHENLPLKVNRHKISAHGQCQLNYSDPEMKIVTYELNSKDLRSNEYQVKTMFHELFHAKSHGIKHDVGSISFRNWAYLDDVFAETTAHYMNKSIGIVKEITPSYARHLIDTLPKLKKLPEFKTCNTISDFGKVAYNYRFSSNNNAKWKLMWDTLNKIDHNMIDYSKDYLDYITGNKGELVDQLLENMPQHSNYKNNMVNDLTDAISDINNGYSISGNKQMVFENALVISMNRLGVK